MNRPTLSLAVIAKNEEQNVERFLSSFQGAVDEIVFVDTGSTDKTVQIAKTLGARVEHFEWINDFSAARNYAFSKVKTDYVVWADLDDVLLGKEAFIDFRDNSMKYFDYILANYNYALDKDGKPLISFARERIFNMKKKPQWHYFVHEGVKPMPGSRPHFCTNWAINHMRTEEDMKKDKARNLNIFEEKMKSGELDGRLTFYYGKELYENNQTDKAIPVLLESVNDKKYYLEPHDRILALQYACYSMSIEADKIKPEHQLPKIMQLIELAQKALLLDPRRAEFWNIMADSYMKMGRHKDAAPFYSAAKGCIGVAHAGARFSAPIHTFAPLYKEYPRIQLARILTGDHMLVEAKRELNEAWEMSHSEDAKKMLLELEHIANVTDLTKDREKCSDIVFTCPPQSAYPFDEELYKTKGMGGSETALIEMAKWLKKLTGRSVKVFNMREKPLVSESGVEYYSTNELIGYFSKYEPAVHIAWRHNIRVTNAPSYLWCHDLMIPGVEGGLNQDKVLTLSPFHQNFLCSSQGIARSQTLLTRNGISPEKWQGIAKVQKNPYKFVYASSPDRGLDRVLLILDQVREKYPVELHVYYGLENLYKYGQGALADHLKKMMADRPWVKYHGFTEQKQMYKDCADAAIICHPNDFIETHCITALEMPTSGVYMITRRWGGIANTLAPFEQAGMAKMLEIDSVTPEEHKIWAQECIKAIEEKAWEKIKVDPNLYSWQSVAKEWVKMFDLEQKLPLNVSPASESPGADISV